VGWQCNVLVLRKTEIRLRAGGGCHPHTLHPPHTHTFLVGGLRSGPPHSTDKCLAPARPQSAFTGQQIRTGGHTPNPFILQSVYLCECVSESVWGGETQREEENTFSGQSNCANRDLCRYEIMKGVRVTKLRKKTLMKMLGRGVKCK